METGAGAPRIDRACWLGWDGRELRWRIAAPATACALHIDGIVFQRFAGVTAQAELACAFDYSPTGHAEVEFSVTGTDGETLAGPWRVRFGAATPPGEAQWSGPARALAPLAGTPQLPERGWAEPPLVAVIVPIHNAAASVRRCLSALLRWTPATVRLILIDDASSEAAIAPLLDAYAREPRVQVARHAINRGYTDSVNHGMRLAGAADVVLLNSDTEVGPRWLQSLRIAAYGDGSIATVTAVSDNAGAFSVPELEQYCPIPPRWDLASAQRAVLQQAGLRYPQLPTGNGFCMYVKRAVIERIGMMDAEAFPAGYGEENDFCQRAVAAGWRNVIAGNVLVRHERSASFGDARRAALGEQGMAVLRQRYPAYESDVGATLYSFTRRVLDYRVRRAYAVADASDAAPPRPRVLAVAADAAAAQAGLASSASAEFFALVLQPQPHGLEAGPPAAAIADPAGMAAWLLGTAIEAICLDGIDSAPRAVAEAAALLGIPIVASPLQLPAVLQPGADGVAAAHA
jgi:GT2 family glycosyltransferase